VIISGDSDFSPLVSKLRENAKKVIGVGVKQSCSDLLVTNCDEFIYYDDLVRDRESQRNSRRDRSDAPKRSPEDEQKRREKGEERKTKAVDIVAATFVDLMADRGESERIWASVLKEVVKRRNPGFNESYYGFRTFGNLLEEAANRGLIGFGRDDKGAFVFRAHPRPAPVEGDAVSEPAVVESPVVDQPEAAKIETSAPEIETAGNARRRGGRRSRSGKERGASEAVVPGGEAEPVALPADAATETVVMPAESAESKPRRGGRRPRKAVAVLEAVPVLVETRLAEPAPAEEKSSGEQKPAKAKRTPRARKPKSSEGTED